MKWLAAMLMVGFLAILSAHCEAGTAGRGAGVGAGGAIPAGGG